MDDFYKKILLSELLLKKTFSQFGTKKVCISWSGGKDSTVVLHLVKNMFRNKIPCPVLFSDSTFEFEEVYEFVKNLARLWNLNLIWSTYINGDMAKRFDKSPIKKSIISIAEKKSFKNLSKDYGIRIMISGARWYEPFHRIDKFFKTRGNLRMIYPILHWAEKDVWRYTRKFNLRYVSLYDDGYKHLEEKPFSIKQNNFSTKQNYLHSCEFNNTY